MTLSAWQQIALDNWTLTPEEQMRPIFGHMIPAGTVVLTVRAGWG